MGKTFRGNVSEKSQEDVRINLLFEGLEFQTPGRAKSGVYYDVSITKLSSGFSIVFRNGSANAIGDYVSIATKGNTLFFKADEHGWKITRNGKHKEGTPSEKNGYVQLKSMDLTNFIGDYEIKYFEPLDVWYVQKEIK